MPPVEVLVTLRSRSLRTHLVQPLAATGSVHTRVMTKSLLLHPLCLSMVNSKTSERLCESDLSSDTYMLKSVSGSLVSDTARFSCRRPKFWLASYLAGGVWC